MTSIMRHGVVAVVCLMGAVALFVGAVLYGVMLIHEFNAPFHAFIVHTLEQAGKASEMQRVVGSNMNTETFIALIIATISVSAGVGFARAMEEISKVIAIKRKLTGWSEPTGGSHRNK